ncbi:MAG TPA: serine hydrolase domain-containing protein [Caulobacteraceae bacterium]|jgi:CubicO group peptidase (beta-lactamase class C family)|nr:serine hydrolase domain-containing protein [Caulobacteraceae bacterium]
MTEVLAPADPESLGVTRAGLESIDRFMAGEIASGDVPGAALLVARRGRLIHRSVQGVKNLASGDLVTDETIFVIYSMTKPVTAAAMMILWDEGRWSPNDPIAKHLPEFANVKGSDGAAPNHPPTMGELMTHTAGFGYGLVIEELAGLQQLDEVEKAYHAAGVWKADSLADFSRRVAGIRLAYQPGSQFRYSLSMDLQGAIVERLTGESLPGFMRRRLFEPLGMVDTDFFVPEAKRRRLATVYHKYGVPSLTEVDFAIFRRDGKEIPKIPSGGGGLYSTAMDYARFAQMLLNRGELGGARVLSEAAVKLMTTNHIPGTMLEKRFLIGAHTFRPGYGYGFNGAVFHDPELAGSPVGRGTYQWDGASGVWFWVDPVNEVVFVGLIQRMMQEGMGNHQSITQRMLADAMV